MFARYQVDDELYYPAAGMLRVIRGAGYDTTNESNLQMGTVAYYAAQLVCRGAARIALVQPAFKSRAGRNEPCPCGSGRKYKKCCLDKDRPVSADNDDAPLAKIGPEILPRLWDDDAMFEDCAVLGEIMDRDPAFANVGFSPEKIASFMDRVFEQEPSLFGAAGENDDETRERAIDDLAARYVRESGDRRVTRGLTDKFLAAAKRAQSKDEARALATGIYLALVADAAKDPADDLLSIIFFRKALFEAARSTHLLTKVRRVLDRFGADEDELRRLMEANDPALMEKVKAAMDEFSASELEVLQATLERRHKNLRDTIVADEFPVPMPCATQIALVGRLASTARSETHSQDDMSAALEAFCDELIEEDYVQYGQLLDRWLEGSKGQSDQIIDAVNMMRELCTIRSIEDVAPRLLIRSIRKKQMMPFDQEEQDLIDGHGDGGTTREFIAEYSSWLREKGYPGMASRLLLSWETALDAELPQRKLSVG